MDFSWNLWIDALNEIGIGENVIWVFGVCFVGAILLSVILEMLRNSISYLIRLCIRILALALLIVTIVFLFKHPQLINNLF